MPTDERLTGSRREPLGPVSRVPMREQEPAVRTSNFAEVPFGYSDEEARIEANRCLGCRKAPCVAACPVAVPIPTFISQISDGAFAAAARTIRQANSLPAICGRVCPQEDQCEKECLRGRRGEALAIGHLERFAADWERRGGRIEAPARKPETGRRIAVAGSGPAGLTAASELAKEGCSVVVFEALHELGGVLTYGIPEFRLPKAIVRQEIADLEALGVKFVRNFVVGRTETVDRLLGPDGFEALFIGTGAGLPAFLGIPGESAIGVYSANEYLTRSNLMKAYQAGASTPILCGRRVVTVGGGNVAMDAARTALRLGAEVSTIVYRRGEAEMPARAEEVRHAREEGVVFRTLANPVAVIEDGEGFVRGLTCLQMELGEPDASGRRSPKPVPGSEFEVDCDIVVVAIGNRPNPLISSTTPDIRVSAKGTILANPADGRTSRPRVYAGGDIVTGAATVIRAMGAGKAAARSILEDLAGTR
ncbi:MAG TPA: NADPH-dependent glutamate synthase [Candidatus Aminicenantes bacterium]|nr:NADPH-dependent glutamate synthase [Candidatus Aminicenantes bacterium]HRY65426.1 NADPH-dependent glutamate synthase [Candidatus Aminicenantes bacterium]HRZ72106.1 NADPH-dependent glutamate synthase [Candidatus Aminicenantes bacterium]